MTGPAHPSLSSTKRPLAALAFAVLSALALGACSLIDPLYDTKEAVLEATGNPEWSFMGYIQKCPANPEILRGTALVPNPERKLRGIGFVVEPSEREGEIGPIHWMPHETFDLSGPILESRFFAKLMECEFRSVEPLPKDPGQYCFASYCPCAGDPLALPEASAPYMSDLDAYMCQLKLQQPENPILTFPPENVERDALAARARYRAALAARQLDVGGGAKEVGVAGEAPGAPGAKETGAALAPPAPQPAAP